MKILFDGKAIIIGLDKIDSEVLDLYPDLKVIGSPTTGLDHINLQECERRGIKVIFLQGSDLFMKYITSTAEHTIGLMIALLRNYNLALNGREDREFYKGHTLFDKTLGIIGYGRVGKQVEQLAKAFGMKVLSYDKVNNYKGESDLNGLLYESDVVSLHIPLQDNEGFFTKQFLGMMKPAAYLINTSRDKVIERGALRWALDNEMIAGAAVDFIDSLELVEYAKTHDNLVLTNHIGGCTHEDMERTKQYVLNKVENYLEDNKYV